MAEWGSLLQPIKTGMLTAKNRRMRRQHFSGVPRDNRDVVEARDGSDYRQRRSAG
jgi:hypothetical protein